MEWLAHFSIREEDEIYRVAEYPYRYSVLGFNNSHICKEYQLDKFLSSDWIIECFQI